MDVHKSITMIVVLDVIGQAESLKAIYRGRGIDCSGHALYRADQRSNWPAKLNEVAARFRAESLLEQLESLSQLRKQAKELR
jgi:hypothetical protein